MNAAERASFGPTIGHVMEILEKVPTPLPPSRSYPSPLLPLLPVSLFPLPLPLHPPLNASLRSTPLSSLSRPVPS